MLEDGLGGTDQDEIRLFRLEVRAAGSRRQVGLLRPAGPTAASTEVGALHDGSPRGGLPGRGQVDLLLVRDCRAGEQQRGRERGEERRSVPRYDSPHSSGPWFIGLFDGIGRNGQALSTLGRVLLPIH